MTPVTVSPAADSELVPALQLLLNLPGSPAIEGQLKQIQLAFLAGEYDPAGLLVVRDGSELSGVILVQPMPGAVGVVWPPRARTLEIEDALVQAACTWLRTRGVKVCQAFVPGPVPCMAALERNGFKRTTQLAFMHRRLGRGGEHASGNEVSLVTANGEELISILLETHIGSLDCPELDGSRTLGEIAEAYRALDQQGYVLFQGGRAVGAMLLGQGQEAGTRELVYFGLIPSVRGQGLGSAGVKALVRQLETGSDTAISLAVDIRNGVAMHLYRRHGFVESERREVFLANWPA
jgi:ribosomal protein S18 acetylase RimI-like enzyme